MKSAPIVILGTQLALATLLVTACNVQPSEQFFEQTSRTVTSGAHPAGEELPQPVPGPQPQVTRSDGLDTTKLAQPPPVEVFDHLAQGDFTGQLDAAELEEALTGLQLLLDQEYRATLDLNAELMEPEHTNGWRFGNHDYSYLAALHSNQSVVIGHSPAQILSVVEATSPEPGRWLLTVLTSELSMEILTADGVHLLDTRGNGNLVATYEINRV